MVAARKIGFGWFWRREERTFGFQQGAEGTNPRGRGFDPHRRRSAAMMKKLLLAIVFGLVTAGCSLDQASLDAACTPPFSVMVYERGRPVTATTITNESLLSSEVQDWLMRNSEDWQVSFVTFAPDIEIFNQSMKLNFTPAHAVLNMKNPKTGRWKQVIKKVDTSDIEFLKEIKKSAEQSSEGTAPR
jgi:hypothetical protein